MERHAFVATRKGTPLGNRGGWFQRCDICGEEPDAQQHAVSNVVAFEALVDTIEGIWPKEQR